MKGIRNGSLYFNEKTERVERVRAKANSQSVFTTVHGSDLNAVRVQDLSLAGKEQLNEYLNVLV